MVKYLGVYSETYKDYLKKKTTNPFNKRHTLCTQMTMKAKGINEISNWDFSDQYCNLTCKYFVYIRKEKNDQFSLYLVICCTNGKHI